MRFAYLLTTLWQPGLVNLPETSRPYTDVRYCVRFEDEWKPIANITNLTKSIST